MAKQSSQTTNHSSDKTVLGWVSDVAERVGVDRVGTYLGVDRVSSVLGEAMQGAARTKARVDRNIEVLFTLANLPSKRDYQSLQTKLDTLQGALMNLTRKLDHLTHDIAARTNGRASSTRAKANGAARKSAAKSSSARKSPRKSAAKSQGKASSGSRTSRARGRKSKPRR